MASDAKPELPVRPSASSGATASPSVSAIRQRIPHRQSSNGSLRSPPAPELPRRRSSILSYSSIEDATNSFAEDIVNPAKNVGSRVLKEEQDSHWHSTPLAFAILPAIAGLLFNNGSAFVTDVLLLGFAALFMNWSIRMPREWYYAAQAVEARLGTEEDLSSIPEALDEDDLDLNGTPDGSLKDKSEAEPSSSDTNNAPHRDSASAQLRRQELLALTATFLFPAIAAYLLHLIRAQLSRPSTGLVSDYNLCVFLLAAEFWPCRQVARLVTHRTLHLQRAATGLEDPYIESSRGDGRAAISALAARLADMEAKLADHTAIPQTVSMAQKADIAELATELRKRYEPRLEGLERAVRRYEKRSATLAMVTEQRLQNLEGRLQDALSLAAVAAQKSQSQNGVLAAISTMVTFPFKLATAIVMWPVKAIEEVYLKLKALLIGPMPAQAVRRTGTIRDERPREKAGVRKVSR